MWVIQNHLVFARKHAQVPYGPPKRAPYRSKRWIEKTRKQDRIILTNFDALTEVFVESAPRYQRHPDRNNQPEPQRASQYMPLKRRRVWLQPGLRRKTGSQTGAARAVRLYWSPEVTRNAFSCKKLVVEKSQSLLILKVFNYYVVFNF
jgi:hypothetical protein